MKHTLLLMAIGAITCSFILPFSNNSKKNSKEPFSYSFVAIDPATGKAKAKLQPNTAIKQKPKGKTTAVTYSIEGAKSSVRLKLEDNLFDVISDMQSGSLNPILYIGFHKLTSSKNGRTLVIDPNSGENVFGFNISPIDANVYRLIVGAALQSGEYAFVDKTTTTPEGHLTVWTFGID